MNADVLVAYASAHGSTKSIAERITAALPGAVLTSNFDELGAHQAYVLGSAIHNGAWLPEAMSSLRRHRSALAGRPVWAFSVGMAGAVARPLRRLAMSEGPKIAETFPPEVLIRDHHLFTGRLRREDMPGFGGFVFRMLGGRFGDFRDWDDVDAWTTSIASALAGDRGAPTSR